MKNEKFIPNVGDIVLINGEDLHYLVFKVEKFFPYRYFNIEFKRIFLIPQSCILEGINVNKNVYEKETIQVIEDYTSDGWFKLNLSGKKNFFDKFIDLNEKYEIKTDIINISRQKKLHRVFDAEL